MNLKYYIITYGCQSNISDSERIISTLDKKGHKRTSNKNEADLIFINSCSVRQSAVNRIYGQIENIKKTIKKPIIVTGCLLEKDKKNISKIVQFLEINEILSTSKNNYLDIKPAYQNPFSALVPIMTGCNNFCTYCAVPYTRGREKSRSSEKVLSEIQKLASDNYKEIWLLGQNVNSYEDGQISFVSLLESVSNIPGNFWIRFTSSHPKDYLKNKSSSWENLIKIIKKSPKVTEYINLPVQSGDDEILKKMNRPYNIKEYKECLSLIKKTIPNINLSTDIIVGFPGETKKQFQNTVQFFKEAEFDMAYISRYSPRPGTAAALLSDNVTTQEKTKRKKILNNVLEKTALKKNKKLIGKVLDVLVENQRKDYLLGKTRGYKTIKFKGEKNLVGKFLKVKVNKASSWRLQGIISKK